MTDLRSSLLSRLADLLATCDAAGGGPPWRAESINYGRPEDRRHIAAHGPSVMRPVWEALKVEVEAHVPSGFQDERIRECEECGSYMTRALPDGCPFVMRLATALGVTADDRAEVSHD